MPLAVNVSALQFGQPDFVTPLPMLWPRPSASGLPRLGIDREFDHAGRAVSAGRMRELPLISASGSPSTISALVTPLSAICGGYPRTRVKIDQSFLQEPEFGPAMLGVSLKSIVVLAHNIGFTVTAEGIETLEQLGIVPYSRVRPRPGPHVRGSAARPRSAEELLRDPGQRLARSVGLL